MYSNAKAIRLVQDIVDLLSARLGKQASPALNSIRQNFFVDANGASWPYAVISNNGNEAAGQPVVLIQISNVDMVSKDIFGNQTYAYAPHILQLGYELGAAPSNYAFETAAFNATVGAIYQDSVNAQQFLVSATMAGTTSLLASSLGTAPGAAGNLVKVSGTGDASVAYSSFVSSGPNPGTASPLTAHADLIAVEFEAIKSGVRLQVKELASGTAVTAAAVNAAVATADIDQLYWPTKLV